MRVLLQSGCILLTTCLMIAGCDSRFASYQPATARVVAGDDGYSVHTVPCPAMDISPARDEEIYEGCVVEHNRYKSMVHPEKMLPANKQTVKQR